MKFHENFIFTLDLTGASESIYFEDWPIPWLLLKRKGVFNLRTVPEGKLWMMHLICLPLWFITVDFSTVLQCLKIDPQWKPGNLCHCSHLENDLLSFHSSSIVFFFWHSQTFWLLPLCLSSSLVISASVPDLFSSLFPFSTQLPFGEGLFHFYPQDTSKRRSKRSARSRQRLQKDNRVSIRTEMYTKKSTVGFLYACAWNSTVPHSLCMTMAIVSLVFM